MASGKKRHSTETIYHAYRSEAWLLGIGILLAFVISTLFYLGTRLYTQETIRTQERAQLEKVRIARSAIEAPIAALNAGRLTRDQATEQARTIIRRLTYQSEYGPNYVFMIAQDGTFLVVPFEPWREGNQKAQFADEQGHSRFAEILARLAKTAPSIGVFMTYFHTDSRTGQTNEKLSCFMNVPELNAVIGTGEFTRNADQARKHLFRVAIWSGCSILIVYLIPVALAFRSLHRRNLKLKAEIRDRQQADKDLATEQARSADLVEKLKSTLDSLGEGLISSDPNGRVHGVNPVASRLTGWSLEEVMGRNTADVFQMVDPITKAPIPLPLAQVLVTGTASRTIEGFLTPRGSDVSVEITHSCFPVKNSAGTVVGTVQVFRDVTEENRNREELAHAQRMDAIGQLAGGVAHDFNNMLAGIMGISEYLQEVSADMGPDERNRFLGKIVTACQKAADLSQKLLAFARKGKIQSTSIDVHGVIDNCIGLLVRTFDKRTELDARMEATAPCVIGDGSMILNALLNLAINAQHAMPGGGTIHFRTRNVDIDAAHAHIGTFDVTPGRFLVVEVSDTGTGIPAEHLGRIFDPYFTTKGAGKGTGLGLSAVYGIVNQHHGAIRVSSVVGEGTTFLIYLPVSDAQPSGPVPVDRPLHGRGTVLVVDDEELIRTVTRAILEQLGYRVLLAVDGEDGVAMFEDHKREIDLVILDMIMPRMNGRECFRRIRSIAPWVPIILASGFSQTSDVTELQEAGISGFLKKPFSTLDLSQTVAAALSGKHLQED